MRINLTMLRKRVARVRNSTWFFAVFTAFASASSVAQIMYDKLEKDVIVNKGIRFGHFGAPLPLPPGDWTVVSKQTTKINLSGGWFESPDSAPQVLLSLKSNELDNPIQLLMLSFTPDSIPIRWTMPPCTQGEQGHFKDDFGSTPSGLVYGCASGFYASQGVRAAVQAAAKSDRAIERELHAGYLPYIGNMSDSALILGMTFSVNHGRMASYQMHIRAPARMFLHNVYDQTARAWVHATGLSIQGALQNKEMTIDAFPTPLDTNPLPRAPEKSSQSVLTRLISRHS